MRTPYIQVLTYPGILLEEAKSRVKQLESLGVEEVVFEGHTRIGRLGVLGLGTVGVVVAALARGGECALKIRRTDANRHDMEEEARLTRLANRIGVGPPVYAHTKDVIMMKLLEYEEVGDWLKRLKGPGRRENVRRVVHALLNQCRKLDIMGIDHGQLSNLRKHAVIAGGVPWIIDFESAGTARKPRNVTTAAQYLFIGGVLAPAMRRALGVRDVENLKGLLASYKCGLSDYAYSKLLEYLKVAEA
ncbi:MAG: serine/threonine protein kinase [Nitrososphaerota archaeon]|jgi:putative serine/threonine protein kinase|nr:serine/threonine protein kinase [Nitrososphaerota archaeon]